MSETDTNVQSWPPPPAVSDPLAVHDGFLTALLRAPSAQPLSRMRLYRALVQEKGLDRSHCWLVVRHYCERHDIFPGVRGPKLGLLFLPSLICLGVAVATPLVMLHLMRLGDAATTVAARRAITGEAFGTAELFVGILVGVLLAILFVGLASLRRARREDAEARAKVTQ